MNHIVHTSFLYIYFFILQNRNFLDCLCFLIYMLMCVFSCIYIGMYVYVLYIFLNLIMSIIPTLYFFVEFLSE